MVVAQRVLITGGNCGIGFEAAKQLLGLGHHVIIACRDSSRAQKAVDSLAPAAKASGVTVEYALVDLASFASVRSGAASILQRHPRLDVLLCNAGTMSSGRAGAPVERTVDGHDVTMQANHLGHFLLVHLLMPALLSAPAARVVVVSSELHRKATAAAPYTSSSASTSASASASNGNGNGGHGSGGGHASESTSGSGGIEGAGAGGGAAALPEWIARLSAATTITTTTTTATTTTAAAATAAAAAPTTSTTTTTSPPSTAGATTATAVALSGMQLYCLSKLYNIWFTARLAALLPPTVTANAVTPGWVPGTSLGRGVPWLARMAYQTLFPLLPFTVSVAEGARRVVAVCVGQQEGAARGRYFSRGALADPSPEALDQAAVEALWRLSEQATGVEAGAYLPPATQSPPPAS